MTAICTCAYIGAIFPMAFLPQVPFGLMGGECRWIGVDTAILKEH